jgi:hypothetical protein
MARISASGDRLLAEYANRLKTNCQAKRVQPEIARIADVRRAEHGSPYAQQPEDRRDRGVAVACAGCAQYLCAFSDSVQSSREGSGVNRAVDTGNGGQVFIADPV